MTTKLTLIAALLAGLSVSQAFALDAFSRPEIGAVSVNPTTPVTGEPATIKIDPAKNGSMDCAIGIDFGDGKQEFIEVHQGLPKEIQHTYDKAGSYTVKAEGVDHNGVNNCKGKGMTTFKVSGVKAPSCPSGWEITPGSVKKNGAFACRALPPAEPLKCSTGLKPYVASTGQIGCK
ncbi:PKD domain-containing protein [Leeia oryzae]|uniref:PKD domain-containing protein n=1 Tax=Leeia oryzae TaxID=356662 RepID=UPI000378BCF3|nr:PKD domain-containing protein [Leeia oryzae]